MSDMAGAPPAVPGTTAKSTKLSYRTWLFMQHTQGGDYKDFARLVLGGGPDNMWMGKPLDPDQVCREVEHLYAAGHSRINSDQLQQSRDAITAYRTDSRSVDKLIEDREAVEKEIARDMKGLMTSATMDAEAETGIEVVRGRDKDGPPDIRSSEGGMVRTICEWVNSRTSRKCSRVAVLGQSVCDIHGGTYLEPEEMREILKRGQERLLEVSVSAIEAALDVMANSTNDMVRLKAAELIMDRAGFRPKSDQEVAQQAASGAKPISSTASVVDERLNQLSKHGPDGGEIVHVITSQPDRGE